MGRDCHLPFTAGCQVQGAVCASCGWRGRQRVGPGASQPERGLQASPTHSPHFPIPRSSWIPDSGTHTGCHGGGVDKGRTGWRNQGVSPKEVTFPDRWASVGQVHGEELPRERGGHKQRPQAGESTAGSKRELSGQGRARDHTGPHARPGPHSQHSGSPRPLGLASSPTQNVGLSRRGYLFSLVCGCVPATRTASGWHLAGAQSSVAPPGCKGTV